MNKTQEFSLTSKEAPNLAGMIDGNSAKLDEVLVQLQGQPGDVPFDMSTIGHSLKEKIWEANRNEYAASRSEGSRFANLNILSALLPNGYVVKDRFKEYGRTEDGDIMPLQDILDVYAVNDISIIGEGGIGKTTFLLKLMEAVYETDYNEKAAVPIFIELNRCPAQIGGWYSAKNQKTNFITRYIAAQISSCEIEDVPGEILSFIESEFAKDGSGAAPDYMILLDGFNEVNRGKAMDKNGAPLDSSIRELLNKEIKALMNRPNVRVVTTSRKIDMAYFSGMTKNVELTGVKTEDIEEHLRENRYTEMDIKEITSIHKLMDCLRIPLFLCMFTANNADDENRPSTRGEILYYFFNRSQGTYNERLTAERINARSVLDEKQTLFILDFVLPYIGFMMEYADKFSISKPEIQQSIEVFFDNENAKMSFWSKDIIAFPEYETEARSLSDIKDSLTRDIGAILDCIVNTLGIMYRDKHDATFKYYFIHHHVRDYLAGFYEIQRMRMAAAFKAEYLETKRQAFISHAFDALSEMNDEIWNEVKQTFIGEILGEHKNAPVMVKTGKWELPPVKCQEQLLLKSVLDIFRLAKGRIFYGVYNVVEAMKKVRGNLAGEDFSSLDLSQCRFHGTTCSIGRGGNRLSANFKGALIADETFNVEGEGGEIVEFAYSVMGTSLFTISEFGVAKNWEVETGKCLNTYEIQDWDYYSYDTAANYFVMSAFEDVFLTHGICINETDGSKTRFIQECGFKNKSRTIYAIDREDTSVRSMWYSVDNKHIIAALNSDSYGDCLYIYEQGNKEHIYEYEMSQSDTLATAIMANDEAVFLCCENDYENRPDEMKCRLVLLNIKTNETQVLYTFATAINLKGRGLSVLDARKIPIFCVNNAHDRLAFIDGDFIKEYHSDSRMIMSASHKITDAPVYINYLDSDNDYVFAVYNNTAVKYDMRGRYDPAIYERDDLEFSVKGCFGGNKLLLFDNDRVCYEWDVAKDTAPLKYKHHDMNALGIYLSNTGTELIVPFDNDSIVFIDIDKAELSNAIYYGERESSTGMCLYDKTHDRFAALLESDNYEFIKNFDVQSCGHKRTYYDFVDKHKIRAIEVSARSNYLLCAFDKKVVKIDLDELTLTDVYIANGDEQIRNAHYYGDDDIRVVLCEPASGPDALLGPPRIYEFQKTKEGNYRKSASYRPPYVPLDMLEQYISDSNITFGIERGDGLDLLCLSAGIFLSQNEGINSILTVDKHLWNEDGHEEVIKYTPKLNEHFYICCDESFDFNKTLLYVSDDFSKAVTVELESQQLTVLNLITAKTLILKLIQ